MLKHAEQNAIPSRHLFFVMGALGLKNVVRMAFHHSGHTLRLFHLSFAGRHRLLLHLLLLAESSAGGHMFALVCKTRGEGHFFGIFYIFLHFYLKQRKR